MDFPQSTGHPDRCSIFFSFGPVLPQRTAPAACMNVRSACVCADDDRTARVLSAGTDRADDGDNYDDTATEEVLAWDSPAMSLALERVFEFHLADEIDLRLQAKTSVVARVETARWVARCTTGPLRASPEFRAVARRVVRGLGLASKRVAGIFVHQWGGLAALDQPPSAQDGRGSITLVIGSAGSGKSHASNRLCPAMSQAMARASGLPNAPYAAHDYMVVDPHEVGTLDEQAVHHLTLSPHARTALVYSDGWTYMADARRLRAQGFHVVVNAYPTVDASLVRSAVGRVLAALGPRGSHCRQDALCASVAEVTDVDPAAIKVLFDAAPDYAYLWFEPVGGRFGPDRTVITLSCASDFETADGSAPPLDPRQSL